MSDGNMPAKMPDCARVMWMRGGTSKGGYFLADDLPGNTEARDAFLLRIMGSPDAQQIDGMGCANPLTSKVAVVRKSTRDDADVDYLFLQVFVDQAIVTDAQNCGNILAGVGPFAIERGLVEARDGETRVAIHMENTGRIAIAAVRSQNGKVSYEGDMRIDGVPGTAAAIPLEFSDITGGSCGALLPTGHPYDEVNGIRVTLIDNGMPCVLVRAQDVGITGYESCEILERDDALKARIESVRLAVGERMNLGDVRSKSVPKIMLIAPPRNGGAIMVRSFIPHRVHSAIGVFAAVSLATACLVEGTVAAEVAVIPSGLRKTISVEHPTGETTCVIELDDNGEVVKAALLRTARKLIDGVVFA